MVEKKPKINEQNTDFQPAAPMCTSTRLRITQNLVEKLFLCILYNFEDKRALFDKDSKKNQ